MAEQYPFGTLGKEIRKRIRNDYDAKIIVTSHNSQPGLGKTTFAIRAAHAWDPHGWSAEQKAFMNAHAFHNKYMDAPPGSVLLFDEVENEADARRSVSTKNVELSQMLATQRFRNIVSIYTLPAVSMLDSRIMELADYWVNVMKRGVAHPYKIYVNDFTGNVTRKWIGQQDQGGNGEMIMWDDVERGEQAYSDKEYLDELKKQHSHLEREYVPQSEVEDKLEKAIEDAKRDKRDAMIHDIYEQWDVSQSDIAALESVGVSQPTVQKILSRNE